jgi:predicted O-methyltransferase YrrM
MSTATPTRESAMTSTPHSTATITTTNAADAAMEFTTDWFVPHEAAWNAIVPQYQPRRVLEIGSYEGRSTCHLIGLMAPTGPLEIACIDTWGGGREHAQIDMSAVEQRFDRNIARAAARYAPGRVSVRKMKGSSVQGLAQLIAEGREGHFDMAYVDGSHEAPDVMIDAVMAFRLVRLGGLIIFDDYVWGLGPDAEPLMTPKPAIDAFLNTYMRKVQPHPWMPLCQIYCRKLAA